jgi:phosphatidyl-myo-inositol alpha-mannosyltransferase
MVASFVRPPTNARYNWHALRPEAIGRSQLGRISVGPMLLNRRWRPVVDVLHLHGDDWFFVARDVPTVRTFHGSARAEAATATTLLRRLSQSALYPLELLAARLATSAYAVAPGSGSHRIHGYLHLGIELPSHMPAPRAPDPTVLFVGTWTGRKRGHLVHSVFRKEIRPALPNAQLWMVSDECEPAEGVRHFPAPDDSALVAMYQHAWVFCLPSTYEGFGIPYLEAMANGAAVVSTPNEGASFVTRKGEGARLVDDGHLGDEVVRLLTDEQSRVALAKRGRLIAQDFNWDTAIDAHEHAYMSAIAAYRSRRARPAGAGRT